ncbi:MULTISPECIES: nuclear transport factor 2 family protein [unclassified Streptomyces]|uniref:nuclear transport factor 2 family protein n=1 Tax=unclassified Streptomyces TaxID=2593676 RepID=UPI002DDA0401|nr:nuclear transport factor 2 family protein [Streptomyces sp. NBC_01775]WSB78209.1 nuclear transport factor 2 family protein [Streptomyces sp. NBC_01775]WSS42334.1 nuclear transport factor 2 family protein [Streptomyces sp. NBC_01187]
MDEHPTAAAADRAAANIAAFWNGVDTHDWESVAAVLAKDFTRVGMRADEADTCRGRDAYLRFVSRVTGRMHHHELTARRTFLSADARHALNEATETIQPTPHDAPLTMHFANVMELDATGLLTRLDIYWKTPSRRPPPWITVAATLGTD